MKRAKTLQEKYDEKIKSMDAELDELNTIVNEIIKFNIETKDLLKIVEGKKDGSRT